VFFFEKKNQKTFVHLARVCGTFRDSTIKSLFASFSSEKEDSSCDHTLNDAHRRRHVRRGR
jgi:hypothetical protein